VYYEIEILKILKNISKLIGCIRSKTEGALSKRIERYFCL